MNDTWWVNASELDPDQQSIITIPNTEHQMISGPPGSGKTNLLLLKGSQFVFQDRPNILFLVYTRALREFIGACPDRYDFEGKRVMTINAWTKSFLSEEGVAYRLSQNFETDRKTLTRLCTEQARRKHYGHIYNAIIVDEAQDCLPEEVQLFQQLAEILIVATDERQKIYTSDSPMPAWHDAILPAQRHELRYHYRNGQQICKVADAVTPVEETFKLIPTCRYNETTYPSVVRVRAFDSLKDQVHAMCASISTDLKAYPGETIGVLCPSKEILGAVAEAMMASDLSALCQYHINDGDGYQDFDPTKRIIVLTVHSGKGLEFRTAYLLSAETMSIYRQQLRNLLYMAVTRVKTSLNVYHKEPLNPILQSALSVVKPKKQQADISQLLGKRSNVE